MLSPLAVYNHLPVPLQNLACSFQGWRDSRMRYGGFFRRELDELLQTEHMRAADITEHQNARLRAVIRIAYDSVPYYRNVMQQRGLSASDIRTTADLPKLPLLTKEAVRENIDTLISATAERRRLVQRHTSGTTGKSLTFYSTPESIAFQWAVWWRHRSRFGLHLGDKHVNFTGKLMVPAEQQQPPYWRWNWPARQALVSMHHVVPDKVSEIVRFLNCHDFEFYSGYPSIIHTLALFARDQGLCLSHRPRVVTTGAEQVYDFQRPIIAEFTGAVLTDQYGFSEGCGNASQCEQFRYHEDFEFGVLECVDPQPVPGGGIRGKVVCTGFANEAFPLIRYEVGDTAIWEDPAKQCPCGRQSRVILAIEGRTEDFVITPEGRRIMRFDYIFKESEHVRECQVVQAADGEVTLRVVRRSEYCAKDEQYLISEIARWVSPSLKVSFEYVHEIERESNGKFRAVKSLLGVGARQ